MDKTADGYLDNMAFEILEYFDECMNIRDTAKEYNLTPEKLIELIPSWHGCTDGLQRANDYREFINDEDEDD